MSVLSFVHRTFSFKTFSLKSFFPSQPYLLFLSTHLFTFMFLYPFYEIYLIQMSKFFQGFTSLSLLLNNSERNSLTMIEGETILSNFVYLEGSRLPWKRSLLMDESLKHWNLFESTKIVFPVLQFYCLLLSVYLNGHHRVLPPPPRSDLIWIGIEL